MNQQIGTLILIIVIVVAPLTQGTQHQPPGGFMELTKPVKGDQDDFGDAEIEDLMSLDLGEGSPASPSSLLAIITSLEEFDRPEEKIPSQASPRITNKYLTTENPGLANAAENESAEENEGAAENEAAAAKEGAAQHEDDATINRYPSPLLATPLALETVPPPFYSNQIYNLFHQHGPLYQGNLVLHPPPPERLPPFQTLMTKVKNSFFPIVVERKEGNFTHQYRTYGILKPTKHNPIANTELANSANRIYRTPEWSTRYRRNVYAPMAGLSTRMIPQQSKTSFHESNQMSLTFPGFRPSNTAYGYYGGPNPVAANTNVVRGQQRYFDNKSAFYQQSVAQIGLGVHTQAPYAKGSQTPFEIGQVPYENALQIPYTRSDGLLIGSPVGFSGGSLLSYTQQPGLGAQNAWESSYRWSDGQPPPYVRPPPSYPTLNPKPIMLPFHPQQGLPAWGSIRSTQRNAGDYGSATGVSAHSQKYAVQEIQPWPHPAARQATTPWNPYHNLQNPKVSPSAHYGRSNPGSGSTNSGSYTGQVRWQNGEPSRQSGQSPSTSQQNFGGSTRNDVTDVRVNPFAYFLGRRRPNDVYSPVNSDQVSHGPGTTTNAVQIDGSNYSKSESRSPNTEAAEIPVLSTTWGPVPFYSQGAIDSHYRRVSGHNETARDQEFENDSSLLQWYLQRAKQVLRERN